MVLSECFPSNSNIIFTHFLLNCHIQSIIRFSLTFLLAMLPKGTTGPGREFYWNNISSYLTVSLPTLLRGKEISCLLSEFRRRSWPFYISLFGWLCSNSKCILKHIEINLTDKKKKGKMCTLQSLKHCWEKLKIQLSRKTSHVHRFKYLLLRFFLKITYRSLQTFPKSKLISSKKLTGLF